MKTFALTLAIILTATNLPAQLKFGKIEKADLEISGCDFDKEAEALVLYDEGENYFEYNNNLERHVRIKILKDKGLDIANIKIKYYSFGGEETVKGIEANTYNLDANGKIVITKLEKKQIFDTKLNKRWSQIAFSMPDAKAGSVIEYKYRIEGGGGKRWYFQQNIPVLKSRYVLNFPSEVEMGVVPNFSLPYTATNEIRDNREVKVYTMVNIPALRNEAYITCDDDYLQSLEPRLIAFNPYGKPRQSFVRSWPGIIKELMEDEDFGVQLKKNIPRTKDLDSMLLLKSNPFDKMATIHAYVRKNMEWNGYDNIWALDGVKSAWKDKKGTSGEINLILVNLLKDAGLKTYPVLVSTRENGQVNTLVPGWRQFNKVMALVEIDGITYVLDAVEKYTPAKWIPLDVLTSSGLVIEKIDTGEWGWRSLWNENANFTNIIYIKANIDEDGKLKGNAEIASDGYARIKIMPDLQDGTQKYFEKYKSMQNENIILNNLQIENEKADTLPLVQKISFTQSLNSSGEYSYFNTNLFTGLEKNPFIEDNRFSDVFFGYKQKITIMANIGIPTGFELEELPKNIRLVMPDTGIVFKRYAEAQNDMLSLRINLEFKKPFYSVDEYPEFQEFYKKLFDLLNEQFVIRKKN